MGRLGLRKGAVRLFLYRVDHVRKLDCVLDKEDRDVVANNVPIAFLRVEFDGKASNIPR
jgi:hypothetical protein